MAEEQRTSNMKKMAGIAALSAAAGAFATAMLTPKSGRDLRNHIKGKASQVADKAQDKLNKTTEE
jgi:gas vesicle protein